MKELFKNFIAVNVGVLAIVAVAFVGVVCCVYDIICGMITSAEPKAIKLAEQFYVRTLKTLEVWFPE